jgi:hypothetical protein
MSARPTCCTTKDTSSVPTPTYEFNDNIFPLGTTLYEKIAERELAGNNAT